MRFTPCSLRRISVRSGTLTVLQIDGWGVTTVTSQPSLAKYFAMFQVRTQAVALNGGKGHAKNSSFGRLVSNPLLEGE